MTPLPAAELGELEAFADLYAAAPAGLGARVERIGGATCLAFPALAGAALFNRALGLGLERTATEGDVEEIARFYRELGIACCAAIALEPGYAWAKFRRGLEELPREADEPRVERVDGRQAASFAEVVIRGYGVPELLHDWLARLRERDGWDCFVAYDGDVPAAAGALFVTQGVGWTQCEGEPIVEIRAGDVI